MLDKPKVELPRLLWADDIELPTDASDYVVKNLINRGDYVIAFGLSGTYKSFWLADLAVHIALGKPYYGLPVRQGGVVLLALEGQRGFLNRILAQRIHCAAERCGTLPLAVWTLPVNFCKDMKDVDAVIATIKREFRNMPVFVGIDTTARAMGGADENSSDGMGQYLNAVDRLKAGTGGPTVASIHHSGKNTERGPRGHYSNYAGGDLVIELTRAANSSVSLARVIKQKDGPEDWELSFKLRPIELGRDAEGDAIVSCVVVPAEQPPEKKEKPVKLSAAQRIALEALRYALEEVGTKPPASNHIPSSVKKVVTSAQWRRYADQKGISSSANKDAKRVAFNRASEALVGEKHVITWNDNYWLPSTTE